MYKRQIYGKAFVRDDASNKGGIIKDDGESNSESDLRTRLWFTGEVVA